MLDFAISINGFALNEAIKGPLKDAFSGALRAATFAPRLATRLLRLDTIVEVDSDFSICATASAGAATVELEEGKTALGGFELFCPARPSRSLKLESFFIFSTRAWARSAIRGAIFNPPSCSTLPGSEVMTRVA
jgi:hypothetical protein